MLPGSRWYEPGSRIPQMLFLVVVVLSMFFIWAPVAPTPPSSLDNAPGVFGSWIADPIRVTISYVVLIVAGLWPFWLRRFQDEPDPVGAWERTIALPFGESTLLLFAFCQVSVFLGDGSFGRTGLGGETEGSLIIVSIVCIAEVIRRTYAFSSESVGMGEVGAVSPSPRTPSPIGGGTSVPATPAGRCGRCGHETTAGDVFCSRCGTRMTAEQIGYS